MDCFAFHHNAYRIITMGNSITDICLRLQMRLLTLSLALPTKVIHQKVVVFPHTKDWPVAEYTDPDSVE